MDPWLQIQRCCMLEEGCLFLCLVSSEVIILIGWLIAPLRSVSMVWEGWSGLDVVKETDNTVSTQHNGTYIKKQSGSGQNANANSFNFTVLRPQQNTPKNNLYWSNTLHDSKSENDASRALFQWLLSSRRWKKIRVSSCLEHSISINMLKISASAADFLCKQVLISYSVLLLKYISGLNIFLVVVHLSQKSTNCTFMTLI